MDDGMMMSDGAAMLKSTMQFDFITVSAAGTDADTVRDLFLEYGEPLKAILAAYETGHYSYPQIARHFGLHFTTVGRIVRNGRRAEPQPDKKVARQARVLRY